MGKLWHLHAQRLLRGGLVMNSVLLSVLLVVATALIIATVVVWAMNQQIEQSADRRLQEGAVFLQASLDETQADLYAVGNFLTHDWAFLTAVQDDRLTDLNDRLALALRLQAMDEALVANTQGVVIAQRQVDQPPKAGGKIEESVGFRRTMAGRSVSGIIREDEALLRQVVYLPIPSPSGEQIIGVLRLASYLDQKDVDRFRLRNGLDASLFFGEARVVTTFRQPDGSPLTQVGPNPAVFREIIGSGRAMHAWRSLPTGQVRSYYVPLTGPDDSRVGMLVVSIPLNSMIDELRDALLPVLPVTLIIILVGATIAYILPRRMREPLLVLSVAASRLRDGDLATPIPRLRGGELSPLAEQLELARRSVEADLKAIANEEARQRALIAAIREAILIVSSSGQISGFNAAASALFGHHSGLQGRPIKELLPFISSPSYKGGDGPRWQGQIADTTGHAVDVEVSWAELGGSDLPASEVYVIYDISRHAELNRLREQLLYNVSHELRAPLAVLENALDILAREYGELNAEEFDHMMGSARRTVLRLRDLLDALLTAGSIQSGRFRVNARPIRLTEIVDEAVETVQAIIDSRDQRVEYHIPSDLPSMVADRRHLRQVLVNLLSNALKYSPAGEAVGVYAALADGHVRITVEDQGPGIPVDQQEGIFDRFYRVRQSATEPGVGLGLAIVKGIVEAHGGRIGVDSGAGVGTRVWFTLPTIGGTENEDSSRRR